MKKTWYCLTHKETGEQQRVCGLGGIDIDVWSTAKLDREPDEFDDVTICPKGKATRSPNIERRDRCRKQANWSGMTLNDALARIEILEERIAKLEEKRS